GVVTRPKLSVPLQMVRMGLSHSSEGRSSLPVSSSAVTESPRTIGRLWRDAVAARRRSPPYLVERDGGWAEISWDEAARRVDEFANGLLALGIGKAEAFGILASTRLDWVLFDFALALTGAITSPVYATGPARDCP